MTGTETNLQRELTNILNAFVEDVSKVIIEALNAETDPIELTAQELYQGQNEWFEMINELIMDKVVTNYAPFKQELLQFAKEQVENLSPARQAVAEALDELLPNDETIH